MSASDGAPSAASPDRLMSCLACAYAVLALLTMSVSARLWWASPLRLTPFEFDYFLGLFGAAGDFESQEPVLWGRGVHVAAMLSLGGLYLALVRRQTAATRLWSVRRLTMYIVVVSLVFALGLPWVSPDVFYYIGTGWLEAHYGLNPYLTTMDIARGAAVEPMFANVFPQFLGGVTPYGPLFQKLAAAVAWLSGGDEKMALALFKAVFLAAHAGNCALVYQLAPVRWRRVALLAYGVNPLILFSVLTCAHNDHLTNLCVLGALAMLRQGRILSAGAALGAAFSCKYFPIVYLPAFLAAAGWQAARESRPLLRAAAGLLGGFLLVALGAQMLYPGSVHKFASMAASGFDVYRNSVHHVLELVSPGSALSGAAIGRVLQKGFIVSYPLLLWAFWQRLRVTPFEACVQLCLATTLAYFVLVNACNQEWYLTWLMGLAFIQPRCGAAWRLALWLSVAFVPFVIFTVRNHAFVAMMANVSLYLILAWAAGDYLRRMRSEPQSAAG